ncbi:MAG: DNA polymerase III subunit beta [Gammaproteobacteria bacterium]|nr:DNA polymerase III subunit beta [Gammaproteobacteria bacterium]
MKFTASRETLLRPLQMVSGIVERRQTLPILGNVLLRVSQGELSLTSTDLEIEMRTEVSVEGSESGETTVPARKFLDICRSLTDGTMLEFTLGNERATLRAGKSRFVLSTLPAAEFPGIEVSSEAVRFTVPQKVLRNGIQKTQFAMAQQDVRYYLNGMLMEVVGDRVSLVATDGHRLALCRLGISEKLPKDQSVIIPRKAVQELSRLLAESEGDAEIVLGPNFIQVNTTDMRFTSKLIDGRFPDYQNVIPSGSTRSAVCEREPLRQALSRVSILSNEKYRGVRLRFGGDVLRIFAHNPEQEEAEEELAVDFAGDELEVGFNVTYLLDALGACEGDQIRMSLVDANSSCLIHGAGDQDSRHIVMPIRL